MTKNELLRKMQSVVTDKEIEELKDYESNLVIGKYNRKILLDMISAKDAGEALVPEQRILELVTCLQSYLNQYMEQTEGHKWVILASLYNTYILEVPMHPIEVTKVQTVVEDGCKVYYCPAKEEQEGSVCRFCVCRKLM